MTKSISYFFAVVTKYHDKNNFRKKEHILIYGLRVIESIMVGKAWEQVGMASGAGN